ATAIAVLANDTDSNGDSLTITAATLPAGGTVVIAPGGTGLTFQPVADFNGTTSFTYTISDGNGGSATATVPDTVTPVNEPPVAGDDTASVVEGPGPTAIDVLANDGDLEGDTLTISAVAQPAHGAVLSTGGGAGLTYQPSPGFSGPDSFTYTISDGHGGSATA